VPKRMSAILVTGFCLLYLAGLASALDTAPGPVAGGACKIDQGPNKGKTGDVRRRWMVLLRDDD
jgi:hypothetical protein